MATRLPILDFADSSTRVARNSHFSQFFSYFYLTAACQHVHIVIEHQAANILKIIPENKFCIYYYLDFTNAIFTS